MADLNLANLVSTASLPATLEVRQMLRQLIDIQDDEYTMFDYLNFTNKVANVPVGNVEYFHFLNSSLYATAEVKLAYTAGAAGATASITLLGSAGVTPLVGEIVTFPNGVNGLITAVSAAADPVITVKAATGVIIPSLDIAAKLIFTTNAHGEGAGTSSVMRTSAITKRSNYIQKFKTFFSETDLSGGTEIELEFMGKRYIFYKQQYEAMRKHELDIANAGYIGAKSNSMTDAVGRTVYTTEGLRNAIINGGGVSHSTATNNVFAPLDDLLSLSEQLDAQRCPTHYTMWASQKYDNAVDKGVANTTAFAGGGINYAAYNGNDQIAIAMGSKQLSMYGYTFDKHRFSAAQHTKLYAATGYTAFLDEAYLIPVGKIKTHASNGATVDRIRVRYMGFHGDDSKRYNEVYTGGLVPTPTDNRDVFEVTYSSNQGFEFVGTEHFAKLTI